MSIGAKARGTLKAIQSQLGQYKKPVLNWSGGKDSTVLLHLLLSNGIRIPAVYYEDPWFPHKSIFVHALAAKWRVEMHNYPPLRVSLKTSPQMVALVSEYLIGGITTIALLKNTIEYREGEDPKKYLCGVDFLMRPCATFTYPWDVALIAHKACDEDPIYGPIPIQTDLLMQDDGPDAYYPLREWSHEDVWDYIETYKVPTQTSRYDVALRMELDDKEHNSDWYPVCVRCVDKRLAGQTVFCPKWQRELNSVSQLAPEYGRLPSYLEDKTV